jgi:hypothetical protein
VNKEKEVVKDHKVIKENRDGLVKKERQVVQANMEIQGQLDPKVVEVKKVVKDP